MSIEIQNFLDSANTMERSINNFPLENELRFKGRTIKGSSWSLLSLRSTLWWGWSKAIGPSLSLDLQQSLEVESS